ncbi:cell division protein FtsQ/DivIB [Tannerella forsythia]|uniref:Cell division protein FtsQ n=1 Tax=Tannerella forsythia TaxID=28112 RepID=A0A3P1Z8D6_TANFO|nr:cell division protein FtsQ [Tannerella forsythia]RRD79399.1 cell division protein FtsQ [Tannerella forsythia]
MKKILSVIVAVVLFCYLVFSVILMNGKEEDGVCRQITVVVKDSADRHFIDRKDVLSILKNTSLYPINQRLRDINTEKIERKVADNELIDRVSVYKTPSGNINIEVTQKTPVLRVFSTQGSYYIDEHGHIMPVSPRYATYLPIASGNIEKSFATTDLYKFALFLQKHDFWNNQIEQIYVYPNKEVELIPRVGDHRIFLGSFDDFREKMDHLQLFYEQAIPKVGWEKYRIINLKYKNQIVCTKK